MSKIILKKLKEMNTIWHPESTLVFKSKDQQVVIGRWDNSSFVDLDEVALELCDTWKFKVDESLIEQEEVEEVNENDGEAMDTDEAVEEVIVDEVVEQEVIVCVANEKVLKEKEIVFPKCYTNFENLSEPLHNSIDLVFSKLNALAKELQETKEKLDRRDNEYEILKEDFDSIQSKFAKLKSLLG